MTPCRAYDPRETSAQAIPRKSPSAVRRAGQGWPVCWQGWACVARTLFYLRAPGFMQP